MNYYILQANYGQGWEDEMQEETKKEALARLKEYQENAGQYQYKIVTRRSK